jgi:hypothetical protein
MSCCKSALILNLHLIPVRFMQNFSAIDRVGGGARQGLAADGECFQKKKKRAPADYLVFSK